MSQRAWMPLVIGMCFVVFAVGLAFFLRGANAFALRPLVPMNIILDELICENWHRELVAINELGRHGASARKWLPQIRETLLSEKARTYWSEEIHFKNLALSLSKIVGSIKVGDELVVEWRGEWVRKYPALAKKHLPDLLLN